MTASDRTDDVETRLRHGLLGQWYPVAKSVQVKKGRPFGVQILDRKIVLWRDDLGAVHCLEDSCPHRGAPLSLGEVYEGNIACRYHGVVVDPTGTIAHVPAMPNCGLEGRKAVAAFEVHEVCDAIFAYVPSLDRPMAPAFEPPAELVDPEWSAFLCMSKFDCNHRYALDNVADPMHGTYLHARSFTLAFGAREDLMKVEKTPAGFTISRVGQRGKNFDTAELVMTPSQLYARIPDLPYPEAAGHASFFRIIAYTTPIDEQSCLFFVWRLQKSSGLVRESWRFLYRAILEQHHWDVLEQDREMLNAMPATANKRELLYQHDIGVSRLRHMMTLAAKAQIAAEEAAGASA